MTADRVEEGGNGDGLGDVGLTAAATDALLVAFHGEGGDGDHRDVAQFLVVLGTGNHYVLDALVGIACVAFGAGVARAVHGVAPRGSPSTSRRETAGVGVGVVLAALVANALFRGELP